jgi:hypothetical protein
MIMTVITPACSSLCADASLVKMSPPYTLLLSGPHIALCWAHTGMSIT